MKVKVDSTKCEGFGLCSGHAPNVFKLDEWGYAFVENDGVVPEGEEHLVQRAIMDCPVHALAERSD